MPRWAVMSTTRAPASEPPAEPSPPNAGTTPGRGGPARVDASMSLLRDVMEHPLDPSYQLAADRRARGEGRGQGSVVVIVTIAVLCGWMVTQGVAELRRPQPGQAAERVTLEREITSRTAEVDVRQRSIQSIRSQIASAQQDALTRQGDAAMAAQAQRLALATGELGVTGPGLEVTLRDADSVQQSGNADPRAQASLDTGRVLDRDLQVVVNGLWVAGAEAVAINGLRLTALAAIRSAGEAILVDFRPLVPPYVVQAVGDPTTLQTGFAADMAGAYVQSLRDNFGVQVAITSALRLDLPGAGAFALRAARVAATPTSVTAPTGSPSPSTGSPSPAPSNSEVTP
jgi:uncharacterized protein YlxW (UPF0749 family)